MGRTHWIFLLLVVLGANTIASNQRGGDECLNNTKLFFGVNAEDTLPDPITQVRKKWRAPLMAIQLLLLSKKPELALEEITSLREAVQEEMPQALKGWTELEEVEAKIKAHLAEKSPPLAPASPSHPVLPSTTNLRLQLENINPGQMVLLTEKNGNQLVAKFHGVDYANGTVVLKKSSGEFTHELSALETAAPAPEIDPTKWEPIDKAWAKLEIGQRLMFKSRSGGIYLGKFDGAANDDRSVIIINSKGKEVFLDYLRLESVQLTD